jgi:hypothetical protein
VTRVPIRAVLGRMRRRMLGTPPAPQFPIEAAVETYHLDEDLAALVRRRMTSGDPKGNRDGDRSVRLPHPSQPGIDIKIKGAGLYPGPVHFGRRHASRLRQAVFDFDGRMMEDVASGHDAAWVGGATFQQATTEYRMAALLAEKGYETLPCLGYGRVTSGGKESWFSVHETPSDWISYAVPTFPIEEHMDALEAEGRLQLELALTHSLLGYAWWVGTPGGARVIKDLHGFRQAHPINMSQISWTMQLFFFLHVVSITNLLYVGRRLGAAMPVDLQIQPFKAAYAQVTVSQHEDLRQELVARYMLRPPEQFDAGKLRRVLAGNPITAALLEACPPGYQRY